MKKIVLVLVMLFMVGYWFQSKSNHKKLHSVLPEKTVFFIDPDLSQALHCKMVNIIEKTYIELKNPQQVIEQSSKNFPEIESMKVQICQSDKICFYIQAAKPLFVLNEKFVVCENGSIVDTDHFEDTLVQSLLLVFAKNHDDVETIVSFVQALPDVFKADFNINFVDKHNIFLIKKDNKNFIIQANVHALPTCDDLQMCQKIAEQVALKPRFKKKSLTCDIRFKNQIVVR